MANGKFTSREQLREEFWEDQRRSSELGFTYRVDPDFTIAVSIYRHKFGFSTKVFWKRGKDDEGDVKSGSDYAPFTGEQVIEASKELMAQILKTRGFPEQHADRVERMLRDEMIKAGDIADPNEPRMSVGEMSAHIRRTLRGLVPNVIGGLLFDGTEEFDNPVNFTYVIRATWGDGELGVEATLDKLDIQTGSAALVAKKINEELGEKIAVLKMENPGDFEVRCVDDTGMEHLFDNGMTYMAESHVDPELLWVWDRNGDRGEYGWFRFRRVIKKSPPVGLYDEPESSSTKEEIVTMRIDKNRWDGKEEWKPFATSINPLTAGLKDEDG